MKSKNILILEDDDKAVKIYQKNLEKYNLFFANNFRDALALIEGNSPFDLYIVDINLRTSKFSGDMLIPFCENEPVIVSTALDLRFAINEKYKNAIYLQKPIKNELLKSKVAELVGDVET
jgi:DNA-binding NtrC family response regulator